MRIFVTGGRGFLGHAVTRALLFRGDDVTVLTRGKGGSQIPADVQTAVADLRDRAALINILGDAHFDAVVHLAALTNGRESVRDPLAYYDVNVGGTLNLLTAIDAACAGKTRLVFASTHAIYGQPMAPQVNEDETPRPNNPYGESKLAAERLIDAYARTGNLGAITLRCFNVAGAVGGVGDSDPGRIIPRILTAAAMGESMTVNGDGSTQRDYVHVADVASAVAAAVDAAEPGHQIYNVGSGVGTSISNLIAAAELATGRDVRLRRAPAGNEPQVVVADSQRISERLGWSAAQSSIAKIMVDAWKALPTRPA